MSTQRLQHIIVLNCRADGEEINNVSLNYLFILIF